MKYDIITVTYNSSRWLEKYFAAFEKLDYNKDDIRLVIVDNSSQDETVAKCREYAAISTLGEVKVIESGGNIGFGAGNNLGVKNCNSPFVFLLNVDTEIYSDAFTQIDRYIENAAEDAVAFEMRQLPVEMGKHYDPVTLETSWASGAAVVIRRTAYEAIGGFDERFGVKFSTYAVPMIAGEIKRFMRDDGSVKVSRAMKQTAKEMNGFIEEYVIKHGTQPSITAIAKQFGVDETETVFILGSSKMPLSLQGGADFKDGKERELIEMLPAKDDQEEWLDKMLLHGAIEALSERDRKVIILRYFRDMTQSEVAEKIGVSQVQISRIESRIIKEFRTKLSG